MRMRLKVLVGLMSVCLLPACGGSAGPASMEYVEVLPAQPKIGDVATVRFKLLDERSIPLAGATVEFKLESANSGVTLSPPTAVSIRGSGYAETQVIASSRVNSVIVSATSGGKKVFSPPITFAGSVPSGRQLTFQCGPIAGDGSGGRHAIGAFDGTRHLIAGSQLDCTAHVGDRNGDGVADALVSFMTEAGTIGATGLSKADLVGDATVVYKTSLPLPEDVIPDVFKWTTAVDDVSNTGEYLAPLWMHPYEWVEDPRTLAFSANPFTYTLREPRRPDPIRLKMDGSGRYENNPRDNLVSMIAITSGEEGFDDTNNNGQYDEGEDYDDLTEPFVDSNDNGTWDSNERFIDVNGNRDWNGKNGKWDANTLIWKQERILWTGVPATEDTRPVVPGVIGHRPVFAPITQMGAINLVCGGSPCTAAGPEQYVAAYLADPWFNSLAQNGDSDKCEIDTEDRSPVVAKVESGSGFAFTYPPGRYLLFTVRDARDPNASPLEQIPRRIPAIPFRATIGCTYTSAPKASYILKIAVGSITGTIE
ncbi:MAG: hypothetical protein Q8N23_20875 [Archangium sp.]|nr:hypothetical protein [Archangium sp.]MDP3155147.1 hypothetical protein [Archangium sp.]MDP3573342.1 hypothetical protein [Archangium sp.]